LSVDTATAGAAAAMPTLSTAIRGAFNGPPHVVVRCRPLSLLRSVRPSSHLLLCGVPMDGCVWPRPPAESRFPGSCGRVAREIDARPKALPRRCLNPTRGGRPSGGPTGAGRFVFGFRVLATRLTDKSIETLARSIDEPSELRAPCHEPYGPTRRCRAVYRGRNPFRPGKVASRARLRDVGH
jgi:hypothetical protein